MRKLTEAAVCSKEYSSGKLRKDTEILFSRELKGLFFLNWIAQCTAGSSDTCKGLSKVLSDKGERWITTSYVILDDVLRMVILVV